MTEIDRDANPSLDDETFNHWFEQIHRKDKVGKSYVVQISKGIEGGEPKAVEFVRRAMELDSDFIDKSPLKEIANSLRQDMLKSNKT